MVNLHGSERQKDTQVSDLYEFWKERRRGRVREVFRVDCLRCCASLVSADFSRQRQKDSHLGVS